MTPLALVALLLVAVAVSLLPVASADAAYRHPKIGISFAPEGTGEYPFTVESLAVDQGRNRLFVSSGDGKLYGLSVPTATSHTPLGAPFPLQVGEDNQGIEVAADSADGNIYETKNGYPSTLLGFDSSGAALAGFPAQFPEYQCGTAVDNQGLIAEGDYQLRLVRLFNSSGSAVRTIETGAAGAPCVLEFDNATNDLYVGSGSGVFRYRAGSGYLVPTRIASETPSDIAFDASRGVLYLVFENRLVAYNRAGEKIETFGQNIEEPNFRGIAVDEATGVVYVGRNTYPERRVVTFPGLIVPDVTTGEPVGNEVVSGVVDPAGGGNVTECKVEYASETEFTETGAYGNSVNCAPPAPYASKQNVTATLTGLTKETTYHYRVVATNANGTNVGADETITPHYVQALRTNPATELTRVCATLNGSFTGNSEETHYYFEFGETTTYGTTSAAPPGQSVSGTGALSETYRLCGLTPGTAYHFRIRASNPQGTSLGNDRTFTTVSAVEALTTEAATVANGSEAELHASYRANGEDTHYYFEYGYNILYGSVSATPPGLDNGSAVKAKEPLSYVLADLYPGVTYHFRIVASNAAGTSYGADQSFTTPYLAAIGTAAATEARELPDGTRGVTFNGTINPLEGGSTTYHFEYGPTTSYGTSTPEAGPIGSDPSPHPVSAAVTGLAPGTLYHYRLVATNAAGVSEGPDQTYQAVPNAPTVVSSGASAVGPSSATIEALVRSGNGATSVVVDFGTTDAYGRSASLATSLPADELDHAVSGTIGGLDPNTTYHYRVDAVNFSGVTHGPDQTFATAGVPIVLSEDASEIGQTSATFSAGVSPNLLATTYRFEYGPEGRYGSLTTALGSVGADRATHNLSVRVGGLTPGTTYQFRVVASNALGTTAGGGRTFKTTAPRAKKLVCKKGTVKRKGKCVKKKTKHKKKHGGHKQKGKGGHAGR